MFSERKDEKKSPEISFLLRFLADITNMDGGKLELAELQGTRTFILGHSVSFFFFSIFSFLGKNLSCHYYVLWLCSSLIFLNLNFNQENKECAL